MKKAVVLDSFALVSLFHRELGWRKVRDVLRRLESSGKKAYLSLVNWGEFFYVVRKRAGRLKAEEALLLLEQLPVELVSADKALVKQAAEIKSEHPVSYADAFCIATALQKSGQVMTSDPEFRSVEHLIEVVWLTENADTNRF
jgi:ribonuclease VapC